MKKIFLIVAVAFIVSCKYSGTPNSTDSTVIISTDSTVIIDSVIVDTTK